MESLCIITRIALNCGGVLMSSSEYRKLQITGGSTIIVSLPKHWINQHNLSKGDLVTIEGLSSGDLRISPIQYNTTKTVVTIDCGKSSRGLHDLLIGAYLTGCEKIKVVSSKKITRVMRNEIRDFLRDTRGMEIESDEEKKIQIISILNPTELRLQVSVNRMYILISSLVTDCFEVLSGESIELLSDILERERQIDARRLLIERQVASALKRPSVEKMLAVNRFSAMEHANIARILERMGDHATRLAFLVRDNSKLIKTKPTEMPFSTIPIWVNELKTLVHNMYTKDVTVIHNAKTNLSFLSESIEDDLWTGRKSSERLFCEFQISESIRRICAYGVNFSEALLNMFMHERIERDE